MKAYNERKSNEAKLWQMQVNTAAWLQGIYISAAIGACISKECQYPEKPVPMFKDEADELSEDSRFALSQSEIQIRNQVQRAQDALNLMSGEHKTIIGEKRI